MRVRVSVFGSLLLAASRLLAGPPVIDGVEMEVRAARPSLAAAVEAWRTTADEDWLGWHVPARPAGIWLCCWDRRNLSWRPRDCNLTDNHRHFVFSSDRPTGLVDNRNLVVLMHRLAGRIDELQVYSDGCPLRATGQRLLWLEGVDIEESVEQMDELARGTGVAEEALMALSLHDIPAASRHLAELARQAADGEVRGNALFWLAETGATDALPTLRQALAEDPDEDVREQAIFAISQLPDGQGSPVLLELARDRSQPSSIRQEAFFWFVQAGEEEALELIDEILSR